MDEVGHDGLVADLANFWLRTAVLIRVRLYWFGKKSGNLKDYACLQSILPYISRERDAFSVETEIGQKDGIEKQTVQQMGTRLR